MGLPADGLAADFPSLAERGSRARIGQENTGTLYFSVHVFALLCR